MGKVIVITTGGTISSAPSQASGLLSTGAVNGQDLLDKCQLDASHQVEVKDFYRIPSNHYTFDHLLELKGLVHSFLAKEEVDGVVITHGTDTMEETAFFLDLTYGGEKPIVLTGSQRSSTQLGSDVEMNLRQAILAASDSKSCGLGVLVLFNEEIFAARDVTKVHSSNVNGFSSLGYGKLGVVDKDEVIYYQRPFARKTYELNTSLSPVDLIACCLGSDGRFIDCSIQSGAKGIVLEGFGRGHVPPAMAPKIKEASDKGIAVVITTRSSEGRVYPIYDFPGGTQDVVKQGAVLGGSLSGCKARMKLAVLLSVFGNNREKIADEFLES